MGGVGERRDWRKGEVRLDIGWRWGREEKKKIEAKKVDIGGDESDHQDGLLLARIKSLEEKLVNLASRCQMLEAENQRLKCNAAKDDHESVDITEIVDERVTPEKMSSSIEFSCVHCDIKFVSSNLLDNHMETHHGRKCKACSVNFKNEEQLKNHMKTQHGHGCKECSVFFATGVQLANHIEKQHGVEVETNKQYNCDDCAFQAVNRLELKKHTQVTRHNPSDFKEECYTCKKEFSSYWVLMNHRKEEHPSSKKCRYFQLDQCRFDADTCWYKHNTEERNVSFQARITCDHCEVVFKEKSDLRKHMKSSHAEKVSNCRSFMQGSCELNDFCWFNHVVQNKEDVLKRSKEANINENLNSSVFCMAPEKTPPDQMGLIMNMLNKLSVQVENLEKMAVK